MNFWFPTLAQPNPSHCGHLGVNQGCRISLFPSLLPSLSPFFLSAFQLTKQILPPQKKIQQSLIGCYSIPSCYSPLQVTTKKKNTSSIPYLKLAGSIRETRLLRFYLEGKDKTACIVSVWYAQQQKAKRQACYKHPKDSKTSEYTGNSQTVTKIFSPE